MRGKKRPLFLYVEFEVVNYYYDFISISLLIVYIKLLPPFLFTRYTFHYGKFHITCYTSFLGNKLSISLLPHGSIFFLLSTSLFSKNCLGVREMRSVASKKKRRKYIAFDSLCFSSQRYEYCCEASMALSKDF